MTQPAPPNSRPRPRATPAASGRAARGFFFTLDALLALVVGGLIVVATLETLAGVPQPVSFSESRVASDFLDAIDANATLRAAILDCKAVDPKTLLEAVEAMPSNTCAELNVNGKKCLVSSTRCSCGNEPRSTAYRVFSGVTGSAQTDVLASLSVCPRKGRSS